MSYSMSTATLLNAPYLPYLIHEYFIYQHSIRHAEKFKKVCACLEEFGALDNIDELRKLYSMFTYNENFASGSKGGRDNYDLLLRGLTEIFHYERANFWQDIVNCLDDNSLESFGNESSLADVCCGDGEYAKSFLETFADSKVTMIDRPGVINIKWPGIEIPRERRFIVEVDLLWDPTTIKEMLENCKEHDVVLLSEVLHLKGEQERNAILDVCKGLLKKGGCLLVVESGDPFLDLRLHDLTESGAAMQLDDVKKVINDFNSWVSEDVFKFQAFNYQGRYHHVSIFRKL